MLKTSCRISMLSLPDPFRPQSLVLLLLAPIHGHSAQTGSLSGLGQRMAAASTSPDVSPEEHVWSPREVALAHANAGLVQLLYDYLPEEGRYDVSKVQSTVCEATSYGHHLPDCDRRDGSVITMRATLTAIEALRSGGRMRLHDGDLDLAQQMRQQGAETLQVFILADTITQAGAAKAKPARIHIYRDNALPTSQKVEAPYPIAALLKDMCDTAAWMGQAGLRVHFHLVACHGRNGLGKALSGSNAQLPPGLSLWAPDGPYPDYAIGSTVLAFALRHGLAASDSEVYEWVCGLLGPLMVANSFTRDQGDGDDDDGEAGGRFVVRVSEELEGRVTSDPGFVRLMERVRRGGAGGLEGLPTPCTVLGMLSDPGLANEVLEAYAAAVRSEAMAAAQHKPPPETVEGGEPGPRRSKRVMVASQRPCDRCGAQGHGGHQLHRHYVPLVVGR